MAADLSMHPEITTRCRKHRRVMGMLRNTIGKEQSLKQSGRSIFTISLGGGVLWYNSGTWIALTEIDEKLLDAEIVKETAVITGISGCRNGKLTTKAQYAHARAFPTARNFLRIRRLR